MKRVSKGEPMIKKTAIIVGGSSDIGMTVATRFVENGYSVALTYNTKKIDINSKNAKTYKLDLTDKDEIVSVFKSIEKDFKDIDTLVVCSGKAQSRKIIFDVEDNEIDDLFEINTKGPIRCVREFSKIVSSKHQANIVLVGSFVEKNGCSCESVYTSTKSALSGLAKSLSSELGNLGIRVNVVAPGFIDTKMNNNLTKEEKDEIAQITPLQRLGTVEDVANAVEFLSSDKASFITGQTIFVDGGLILE